MNVLKIFISILGGIGTFWTILKLYRYLYYVGLFYKKKYKPTENKHKYGICIAAHDEEKVIRNLLDSIANQDFEKEKMVIFVVADNCKDKTADIVRDFATTSQIKTFVYEHNEPKEKTKGFALRFLFEKIKENHSEENFEGYFIFDADNVLAPDYVSRMNEAFDAGNDAIVSYRHSKNMHQNWIAFSYAIHWLRTCLTEHRGKNILNLSCRVQGTGFLFNKKYVADGWNYVDLTEDRMFCTDVVVKGGKVAYCEDAKFYDEQPYKIKIALRQRLRWAKGNLQSTVKFCPKLLKNVFKFNKNSIRSYDIFFLNFPTAIESICRRIIKWTLSIILGILTANAWGTVAGIFVGLLTGYLEDWLEKMIVAALVYCFYHKYMPKIKLFKLWFYISMFPVFDIIGRWSMYIAIFKKVEWKTIPHDFTVDVNKL